MRLAKTIGQQQVANDGHVMNFHLVVRSVKTLEMISSKAHTHTHPHTHTQPHTHNPTPHTHTHTHTHIHMYIYIYMPQCRWILNF